MLTPKTVVITQSRRIAALPGQGDKGEAVNCLFSNCQFYSAVFFGFGLIET